MGVTSVRFVEVDVELVELDGVLVGVGRGILVPSTVGQDAVLRADSLPELLADLISALAHLDAYDFSHGCG